MGTDTSCSHLEYIALQMTSSLELKEVLKIITEGLVDSLGAAVARLWLFKPGDICSACFRVEDCLNRQSCLHLVASAGIYTRINGQYRRVPMNDPVIGLIGCSQKPMETNTLPLNSNRRDQNWIQSSGFKSYAGYPLKFGNETLGVMAMFSQTTFSHEVIQHMIGFSNQAAIALKNASLFKEVTQLKNTLQAENHYLQEEVKSRYHNGKILGKSAPFKQMMQKVEQVAPTDATVLVLGETGTGKELIARAIHNQSPRRKKNLVSINCSALSENLIENELFGHDKGAFTGATTQKIGRFELAHGGTLFLDEIGDLTLRYQVKLLRVLQEKTFERVGGTRSIKVDIRLIAATNHDLKAAVQKGTFREDLFYRLDVFPILCAPLRRRKKDISLLVEYFVEKYSQRHGRDIQQVPEEAMNRLKDYSWPGNIRELENVIERGVILSQGTRLDLDHFGTERKERQAPSSNATALSEVEKTHILQVLKSCNWIIEGNRGAACKLDLKPGTLRSRMKKYNIQRPGKDESFFTP